MMAPILLPRLARAATAAILLIGFGTAVASAAEPVTVVPRTDRDWGIITKVGPVSASVSLASQPAVDGQPIWVIRADGERGRTGQFIILELRLADLGIAPCSPDSFDRVSWWWMVSNQYSADYVALSVADDAGGSVTLGASHGIYDNNIRRVPEAPRTFLNSRSSIRWAQNEAVSRGGPRPPIGLITRLRLHLQIPYRQEVWLGPITLIPGPPSGEVEPPVVPKLLGPMVVTDLDTDGVVECILPWVPNNKLREWDRKSRSFVERPRNDALVDYPTWYLICIEDFDADGDRDLAVISEYGDTLSVRYQDAGRFRIGQKLPLPVISPGAVPTALAVADDDGDGDADLFVAYHNVPDVPSSMCVYRLAGSWNGHFGEPTAVPGSWVSDVLAGTYHVSPVDMDGDGRIDLVLADGRGLRIMPGHGDGTYGRAFMAADFQPLGVANGVCVDIDVADMNGDGRYDIYASVKTDNPQHEAGRNFFLIGKPGFRFREVAALLGVMGTPRTLDAAFTELDGHAGRELILLEETRLVAFDLSDLAVRLRAESIEPIPPRLLTGEARDLIGSRHFYSGDLDEDGDVEIILAHDSGPVLYEPRTSGPVWRLDVAGPGSRGARYGATVRASDDRWTCPLLTTHETPPGPILLAARDSVVVRGITGNHSGLLSAPVGAHELGDPGLAGLTTKERALRWFDRFGRTTRFVALRVILEPVSRVVLLAVALVFLVFFAQHRRRRSREPLDEENWRRLLELIGLDSHAGLYSSVMDATGVAGEIATASSLDGGLDAQELAERIDAIRAYLSSDTLQRLKLVVRIMKDLGFGGAAPLQKALGKLESIQMRVPEDWFNFHGNCESVQAQLVDTRKLLSAHFRCHAGDVLRAVMRSMPAARGVDACVEAEPPDLEAEFPMHESHMRDCLRELVTNSLKKQPTPTRVRLRLTGLGRGRVRIHFWDDGNGLDAERGRQNRPGSRIGLALLESSLKSYRATGFRIMDVAGGGVAVIFDLPRYDSD